MSQSRLERLQEKADVKPKADKPVAPASLKMQNQELMEAERKADRYAFLGACVWILRDAIPSFTVLYQRLIAILDRVDRNLTSAASPTRERHLA